MSALDDLASDAERDAYAAVQRCRSEGFADGYVRGLQRARTLVANAAPFGDGRDVALETLDEVLAAAAPGRPWGTVPIVQPDAPDEQQVTAALEAFLAGQQFVGRAYYRDRLRRALRAALHG